MYAYVYNNVACIEQIHFTTNCSIANRKRKIKEMVMCGTYNPNMLDDYKHACLRRFAISIEGFFNCKSYAFIIRVTCELTLNDLQCSTRSLHFDTDSDAATMCTLMNYN